MTIIAVEVKGNKCFCSLFPIPYSLFPIPRSAVPKNPELCTHHN
ncbi:MULTISPECIES: hypothetical protein [unclassified Moorena]|nr:MULTISPECIES: hypothetical protein [unclassified Moorena]